MMLFFLGLFLGATIGVVLGALAAAVYELERDNLSFISEDSASLIHTDPGGGYPYPFPLEDPAPAVEAALDVELPPRSVDPRTATGSGSSRGKHVSSGAAHTMFLAFDPNCPYCTGMAR